MSELNITYSLILLIVFSAGVLTPIILKSIGYTLTSIKLGQFGFTKSTTDTKTNRIVNDLKEFDPSKIIRKYFKRYNHFIVLQYGSSIRDPYNKKAKNNDVDFIVLLVGYPTDKELKIIHNGNIPSFGLSKNFDVVYRDYNSFLFALIAGMPYEHSILKWHKIRKGDEGYIFWLQQLARNILIDRDYLINELNNRQKKLSTEWHEVIQDLTKFYEICRIGYFLVCGRLQIRRLEYMNKSLRTNDVSELAIADHLIKEISNDQFKLKFNSLIKYLKRQSLPVNSEGIIEDVEFLMNTNYEQ
jgi:hypothetical protein